MLTMLTLYLLLAVAFGLVVGLTIQKIKPISAVRWAKIISLIGIIVTTLTTVSRIIPTLLPGGNLLAQVSTQQPFWPIPPAVLQYHSSAKAQVTTGGFQHADVYVLNAGWGAKLALDMSAVALGAVLIAVFIAVRQIAIAVEAGESFSGVSGKTLRGLAWLVALGGEIAAFSKTAGDVMVSWDITGSSAGYKLDATIPNPWLTASPDGTSNAVFGVIQPALGMEFSVELWPILAALGILLLARIIDQGKTLKEDAEGLV